MTNPGDAMREALAELACHHTACDADPDGLYDCSAILDSVVHIAPDLLAAYDAQAAELVALRNHVRTDNGAVVAGLEATIAERDETIRRMALLTSKVALAICEAEWGAHDKKLTDLVWYWEDANGSMCAILTSNDGGMSFNVAKDGSVSGQNLRTVGQLEDAVRAAKGANDAS